jgi:hypothetical protein
MSRVLVVGVDGGTWDLLDALVAADRGGPGAPRSVRIL